MLCVKNKTKQIKIKIKICNGIDDNTKNPALDHLLKIMNKNQLNFTNARTLEKVEKILQSQKTVVTDVCVMCLM